MQFSDLSSAVAKQFQSMTATGLYRVDIREGDMPLSAEGLKQVHPLWATYLSSFPPGADPMYLTHTEHDCSCCRQFIKTMGAVVTIRDGAIVTLWDR